MTFTAKDRVCIRTLSFLRTDIFLLLFLLRKIFVLFF